MSLPQHYVTPGQRFLVPAWRTEDAAQAILSPAWGWPLIARRVYVLTFPVSFPLRWVLAFALKVLAVVVFFGGMLARHLAETWRGQPYS